MDEHWKVVDSGATVVSTTPEQLWQSAVDYFRWCDENPIKAKKTLPSGKAGGSKVEIEYNRPYSIEGLCLHCGITKRYIEDIKQTNDKNNLWFQIMEKILYVIYTQNLEGALVDLYNPIIVSKVLGMDKTDKADDDRPVKVEILDSRSTTLAKSENEILEKLDFGKVKSLEDKLQNPQR